MMLWGGIAIVAGLPDSGGWQRNTVIGLLLIGASIPILAATCRWWAKWFFGFSLFTSLKLVLVLIYGYYWTGPVPRALSLGGLVLFVLLVILTYRFVSQRPQTGLETTALVAALIAVSSMVLSNSLWPLAIAVVLLLAARLMNQPPRRENPF
jgi:hypothetical protein